MPFQFLRLLISAQRSTKTNFQLACLLAFVAGMINAGGFLAISRYTSHMSGIISAIGDDLAVINLLAVLGGIALLASFIFGAATTAIIVSWGERNNIPSQFALPLMLEALVLLMFGLMGANLNIYKPLTIPVIALILCFVMGLQNAIITKASNAELRTTHMTGVVTDIGIELGKLFYWNRSRESHMKGLVIANRAKLWAHTLIFSLFLFGGFIGAISFRSLGFVSVVPVSLVLALISSLQIYSDLRSSITRA